jgi:hypothetical protein
MAHDDNVDAESTYGVRSLIESGCMRQKRKGPASIANASPFMFGGFNSGLRVRTTRGPHNIPVQQMVKSPSHWRARIAGLSRRDPLYVCDVRGDARWLRRSEVKMPKLASHREQLELPFAS